MVFFVSSLFSENKNHLYELFRTLEEQPDSFYVVTNAIDFGTLESYELEVANAHQLLYDNKPDSALNCYFKALGFVTEETLKSDIKYFIGATYTNIGNVQLGLDFLLQSLDNTVSGTSSLANVHEKLGENYLLQREFQKSIAHFDEAIAIAEMEGEERKIAWLNNKIGKSYLGLGMTEEAVEYFDAAISIFEELGDKKGIVSIFGNMAWANFKNGDFYQARKNCYHALRENIALGNKEDELDAMHLLGKIELQEGELKNAFQYFQESYEMAQDLKFTKFLPSLTYDLYESAYRMKEYKVASDYLKEYLGHKESDFSKEKISAIQQLSASYEFERQNEELEFKNRQIALLKQSQKFELQRTIVQVVALVLFIVVASLIVLRQKQQKAKQLELNNKEKELVESKKALVEAELKSTQWEKQELSNRLTFKNQELQNFALHIVEKNDFLQELNAELVKLDKLIKTEESKRLLKELRAKISYNLSLEKDRTEFQNYVEQVNEEFFLRLLNSYPSITESEKRLAALLRMNLSSKEISTIMNITPKSVDMNRYRLRKKFEIQKEVSLTEFISKI